jgi:RHS repeat-associated protein
MNRKAIAQGKIISKFLCAMAIVGGLCTRILATESGTPLATYAYDSEGRRVQKQVAGGTTTQYCYNSRGQILAEYENGSLARWYVYGPGIDEPICMIRADGTIYYYHFDGLGSVAGMSDATGNLAERYSYDAFGEPNRASALGNPYMFTGREYDQESGLYYYRARHYQPAFGRFLQPDPLEYGDAKNRYDYVDGNPIRKKDPLGLYPWSDPVESDPQKIRQSWSYGVCQAYCLIRAVVGEAWSASKEIIRKELFLAIKNATGKEIPRIVMRYVKCKKWVNPALRKAQMNACLTNCRDAELLYGTPYEMEPGWDPWPSVPKLPG